MPFGYEKTAEGEEEFRAAVDRARANIDKRVREIQAAEREGRAPGEYNPLSTEEILGRDVYGRLNPTAGEGPPAAPEEGFEIPGRTRRMLPADEFSSNVGRSMGYDVGAQYPGGVSPPLSGPGVDETAAGPRSRGGLFDRLRSAWEGLRSGRAGPMREPSTLEPAMERDEIERADRMKRGALADPRLRALLPDTLRGLLPGTSAAEGAPPAPPTPRSYTSPLTSLAARYGYSLQPITGGYSLPYTPGAPISGGDAGRIRIPPNEIGVPLDPNAPGYGAPPAPPATPAAGGSIIDKLMAASGEDIAYLRGEPYKTNEEQAMVERAKARIRANADLERQRAADEAGAYNAPLAPRLREIDEQERLSLNDVDQQLLTQTAAERRSRLGESRNVLSYLEGLERSRQAEAMGIEQALEEGDFQRVAAILQAVTGGQAGLGTSANISSNILNYALGLGQEAQGRLGQGSRNIGDLLNAYFLSKRT